MTYVAIASDLHGVIFSIDHNGDLHYNSRRPQSSASLAFPGLGPVIGSGWAAVRELAASRAADDLVLAGITDELTLVGVQLRLEFLAQWQDVQPIAAMTTASFRLRSFCGGLNGQFFGVDTNGHLQRIPIAAAGKRGPTRRVEERREVPTGGLVPGPPTDLGGGFGSSMLLFTNGTRIFGVTFTGELRYRAGLDVSRLRRGQFRRQPQSWVRLETGWTAFQRALAADRSGIYGIGIAGA